MSDLTLFLIGLGVSGVVGSAVALLVWGAAQERYSYGRHVGRDLLRQADDALGDSAAIDAQALAAQTEAWRPVPRKKARKTMTSVLSRRV